MVNFFRRLSQPKPNGSAPEVSSPVSPSKSLRHALVKYVAESAIELAPEILPPFLNPTVPPTGAYGVEVVGERFSQPALCAIAGKSVGSDPIEWEGIAQLAAEPDNPFDPNRVKVVIQEMTVGYLGEDPGVAGPGGHSRQRGPGDGALQAERGRSANRWNARPNSGSAGL